MYDTCTIARIVITLKDSGLGDLYTLQYECTGLGLRPEFSTMYVDVPVWN